MAYNTHDLGDLVRVEGKFYTATTGVLADPTVVKLTIREPDATLTTYVYGTDAALVKASTGTYYADINADLVGMWHYRWWSTGTGQAAEEGRFRIRVCHAV